MSYLNAVLTRWRLILAVAAVTALAAFIATPSNPGGGSPADKFTATTTLRQTQLPKEGDPTTMTLAQAGLFATHGTVPAQVVKDLKIPGGVTGLADRVEVTTDDVAGSMTITARGTNDVAARTLSKTYADTLVQVLRQQIDAARKDQLDVLGAQAFDLARKARAADPAEAASLQSQVTQLQQQETSISKSLGSRPLDVLEQPVVAPIVSSLGFSPPASRPGRVALGLLLGVVLGVGVALVAARVDTRVRTRTDVEEAYGLPVLAEVPRTRHRLRRDFGIATSRAPGGAVADAYRTLRSALLLLTPKPITGTDAAAPLSASGGERAQVVLVTSARAGEGKTSTVVNLAATLAETGQRVLVIDCDVRNPQAHRYLDVPPDTGITDLPLAGGAALSRPTALQRVRLIQAGTGPYGHVAVWLALPDLIARAREEADVILIDSPPVLAGNEATEAMVSADAVLLVCRDGRSTREQAARARELVARMGVAVYGVALIGVTEAPADRLRQRSSERRPRQARARSGSTAAVVAPAAADEQTFVQGAFLEDAYDDGRYDQGGYDDNGYDARYPAQYADPQGWREPVAEPPAPAPVSAPPTPRPRSGGPGGLGPTFGREPSVAATRRNGHGRPR